ncbi:MAG: hypothetical protein JWM40_1783 [Frankiales bacterium]|nr:hypothetical protein [Frankiales bacterium]
MNRLMRRTLRRTAVVVAVCVMATGMSACKKDDSTKRLVLKALDRAIATPHTFVHVDEDLNHKTTVSGQLADSLRYQLLLNVDGKPVWQQVVRDDAVADLFLDPKQVTTYAGAGSSPAVNVVSDYQMLARFLPKNVPPPPFDKLPRTKPIQPTLALLALQQGKWVVDKVGAPVIPNIGTAAEQLATTPFLRPLVMLSAVRDEVDKLEPQWIKKYSKDDLSPFFKPKDDPFPQPSAGVDRYDVSQAPLPPITATSRNSRPEPPDMTSLRKLAIYMKDGKVVQIRENYDVLDRLQDLARLYQIPLQLNSSLGTETQQRIGQIMVELIQTSQPVPYRVHEEQLLLTYPDSRPVISLPSPAVAADLSLFPGQGKAPVDATTDTSAVAGTTDGSTAAPSASASP